MRRNAADGGAVLTRLVHFPNDLQALLGINFNLHSPGIECRVTWLGVDISKESGGEVGWQWKCWRQESMQGSKEETSRMNKIKGDTGDASREERVVEAWGGGRE